MEKSKVDGFDSGAAEETAGKVKKEYSGPGQMEVTVSIGRRDGLVSGEVRGWIWDRGRSGRGNGKLRGRNRRRKGGGRRLMGAM